MTLGGARLRDLDAEYTDREADHAAVQAALDAFLRNGSASPPARVAQRWAGIMGFSADLLPVVGEIPGRPGLWVCGGYSGVGNVPGFAWVSWSPIASPAPATPRYPARWTSPDS